MQSDYFFKTILKDLHTDFKKFYIEHFKEAKPFEEVLSEVLKELKPLSKDSLYDLKINLNKQRNRTKKRWFENYEHEIITLFDSLPDSSITAEVKKTKLNILEESKKWLNEKDALLIHFNGIATKKEAYLKKAFLTDLKYELVRLLLKNDNMFFLELPLEVIKDPIFSIKKQKIELKKEKDGTFVNYYQIDKKSSLKTTLRGEVDVISPSMDMIKKSYSLDKKDAEIINFIYHKIDPRFYKDRTITVDIREMVEKLYNSINQYSYKDLEERLLRITNYKIETLHHLKEDEDEYEDENKFSIVFFPSVKIFKDPITRKKIAVIRFSEDIYEAYVKQQTVKAAYSEYVALEDSLSQMLLLPLQIRRLSLINSNQGELKKLMTIEQFNHLVRFRKMTSRNKFNRILTALECFVDKKTLIEAVEIVPDPYLEKEKAFMITFKPLSADEKALFNVDTLTNELLIG